MNTNLDKFKDKFPNDFTKVPRNGDFIKVENYYLTWLDSRTVEVDLHLSDIQERENQTFDMGVYK